MKPANTRKPESVPVLAHSASGNSSAWPGDMPEGIRVDGAGGRAARGPGGPGHHGAGLRHRVRIGVAGPARRAAGPAAGCWSVSRCT